MLSETEIILALWSCAGLIWWLTAWGLVISRGKKEPGTEECPSLQSLSIFKPLPRLGVEGLQAEAPGLESFICQLTEDTELLLGIHESDRQATLPFLKHMRQNYPEARLKVIYRSKPDDVANPKIAWQKILAREAEGELWLWSDADIVAPPGFLRSAREDYARSNALMVTFPYVVRAIPSSLALLDVLFVNVEFYPGVLLLRKLGKVDFGLGAAMLFARSDFVSKVDCMDLGQSLADDFVLGQKLQPVEVGRMTLATNNPAVSEKEAVLHHLRWNKTVRWNRPFGFAARILVLPLLGWLIYLLMNPSHLPAWIGFVAMIQVEVLFATMICRRVGCRLKVWNLLTMELWSLWRVAVWMGCWFPWPVNWRGQLWWGPRWTQRETEANLPAPDVVGVNWRKGDLPGNL